MSFFEDLVDAIEEFFDDFVGATRRLIDEIAAAARRFYGSVKTWVKAVGEAATRLSQKVTKFVAEYMANLRKKGILGGLLFLKGDRVGYVAPAEVKAEVEKQGVQLKDMSAEQTRKLLGTLIASAQTTSYADQAYVTRDERDQLSSEPLIFLLDD
jgi:hypothetical protein